MKSVLLGETLSERFERLTTLLKDSERFWRHHAFQTLRMPWEDEFPELLRRLRKLSLENAEHLAQDDNALIEYLSADLPLLAQLSDVCAIGNFDESALPDIEPRDIPGRKWQQIRYFVPHVPDNDFQILEWCAGKSHLGRVLAHLRERSVVALEYDAALVEEGKALAAREHLAIDFHCVNVMSERAVNLLRHEQNAIALHACGDLHLQLLQQCASKRTATITLAPCCYHLVRDESRACLSQAAQNSELILCRDDLRTAVHGTVTAPQRQTRQRRQLQAWRLSFDLLQRDVRNCDEYLPTPSLPITVLKEGFESFCRRVAAAKRIDLPSECNYPHYEGAGYGRLVEVNSFDLPRIVFRRALEVWLALDRALFLQERGYRVEIGEFCPARITPRNMLIRAYKSDDYGWAP